MDERLRRTGFALLTAALLLLPVSPTLAAPFTASAPTPALASGHALCELLAWLGSWLGPAPVQSHAAPDGQGVDPDGQPTASDPPGDPILTPLDRPPAARGALPQRSRTLLPPGAGGLLRILVAAQEAREADEAEETAG